MTIRLGKKRDNLSRGTESGSRPAVGVAPSARSQPIEPPLLVGLIFPAHILSESWSGLWDSSERFQSHFGAQLVHAVGIGEGPGTRDAVARIVDPLRAVTLRAAFEERDAILEIGGVPSGHAFLFR